MTMTPEDIYQILQADVTLAFDTSVTVRRGFLDLCDQANRINERRKVLGLPGRIRLCVPAAAHTERLFDLAQAHGENYDVDLIRRVLGERQVEIPSFTIQDAEHCAELLVQRYATADAWHDFKKRRCLECAGLPHEYHHLAVGSGQRCGAPNDWLIIAQASRVQMLLVMDDRGRSAEYALIGHMARSSDVRAILDRLLQDLIEQED